MGRAHAIALAKQGAKVVITDLDVVSCELVADEIRATGGDAMCLSMDVSSKTDVNKVFDEVIAKYGRLDILVNNAGVYEPHPFLELTEEEWNRTININLKGEFLVAQRAAKEMAKNKWGRIINIASIASGGVGVGIAEGAHYSASKGGIIAMTESMAIELAPLGINVNAIGPGAINTPMANPTNLPPSKLVGTLPQVPLNRMGEPAEVSAAVVFLASEEASYVTGSTVYVDGGWLAM